MDFNEIKNLIPQDGEKVILVENGKPTVVLMSFDVYKKRFENAERGRIKNEEKTKDELTIEDLPF